MQNNEVFVFLSFSTSSKEHGKREGQKAKSGEKSRADKRTEKQGPGTLGTPGPRHWFRLKRHLAMAPGQTKQHILGTMIN